MATLDAYFAKLRRHHGNIQADIEQIFDATQSNSPERSLNLSQIRALFRELTGESFPVKGGTRVQMGFLLTVPYICCVSKQVGTFRFFALREAERQKLEAKREVAC